MSFSNPVSRDFKTQFPDIPSQKVANPASRKSPARPRKLASVKIIIMEVVSTGHSSSHGDISSVDIIIQTNNPRPKKRKTVQTTYRILVDLGKESINYTFIRSLGEILLFKRKVKRTYSHPKFIIHQSVYKKS